jgi:SET domain-containing protein
MTSSKTLRRKIEVRDSGVHGRGVYAIAPIEAGSRIVEYKGERISWKQAVARHPHDPAQPNHTFYFHLDTGEVIDALYGGNKARWINHACEPNCEAEEIEGRVFIKALRDLEAGEELFYDYGLVLDERHTAKVKKQFACWCGAATCRGTMLAPKR